MDVYSELFTDLPRQGPGDDESTRKALSFITGLSPNADILDLGSGTGAQTRVLAKTTRGTVYAVDNFTPFLKEAKRLSDTAKIYNIKYIDSSMRGFIFKNYLRVDSFPLIWSEGAIYSIGFEIGLRDWYDFLKPNGYIAVTELSWLKENPPEEAKNFWSTNYPGMQTISENIETIKTCGYTPVANFTLPSGSWWSNYYTQLEKNIAEREEKFKDDEEAKQILEMTKQEINLFRNYSDYYGYEFYIMQKG